MMNTAALVLIDPYNDFVTDGGKLFPYSRDVAARLNFLPNMKRLLDAARGAKAEVFFAPHRQFEEGDFENWKFLNPSHAGAKRIRPFVRGSWGAQFHPDFAVHAGETVVQEHWLHSAFCGTDLDARLRQRGIDRLVIGGMRANTCVEGTARWGVELGYHVTIVKDATAAFRWEEWLATMEANAPTFAHAIVTTDEIVTQWEGVRAA
jgi:nicotinamidase-related amidase